jgi:hypothetical protein
MAGNQASYGAEKNESGFSAVSLRTCGPLALIPVNGKKKSGKIRTEKLLQCATLGSPVVFFFIIFFQKVLRERRGKERFATPASAFAPAETR